MPEKSGRKGNAAGLVCGMVERERGVRMETLPAKTNQSPIDAMIATALDQNVDLSRLEKLWELKMKWEADNARRAYIEAMAEFKKNPPEIEKDRHVKFATMKGVTEYDYATLFNVCEKINSALSEQGLTASWSTEQKEGIVKVTCRITHILGHYEETSLMSGKDDSGGKNSIQAIGSVITYLQRYTLLALTGLATKDQDNDGAVVTAYIDEKQLSTIVDYINEKNVSEVQFLKYMGCETLKEIPAADYQKAINALKAKK